MSIRHCEECGAVLDPAKILRCTKCKACFYCSAACQKRNWRLHKRVCSPEASLRRFMPVEMAVERVLKKEPTTKAPKEAFCYICLEGEDEGSSKLMRGCACRGDSAGFVHLECLTKLAMSKEASGDGQAIFAAWIKCGNCKQDFQGALNLEMRRRFWRRYRSSQDGDLRYNSTKYLAACLGANSELDAANQLLDEASISAGNKKGALLSLKILTAEIMANNGQTLEALRLLQAALPEAAKECTAIPHRYSQALQLLSDLLLDLDQNQEAHVAATEAVAFTKAKFGPEDPVALTAMCTYAVTCAKLGRVEEAKATFEDVLATETRICGRDHPQTQYTIKVMRNIGFAEPSG